MLSSKPLQRWFTAKKTGKRIKFAAVDSYRTPLSHIINLYKAVSKAGAEWFTLCDTVGITNPDDVSYSIKKLKKLEGCKISVHFHNDFSMATSNTIIAALSGADQLELTVNGLGDRAGIASLSPVVTYLKEIKGFDLNIDITKLKSLSNFISKITKIKISPLEPIIGDYCFKHSPSIHVAGVLKNPQTFEPINPHLLNQTRDIVLGRYSGKKSIKSILQSKNIKINNDKIIVITNLVKKLARRGVKITEKKLLFLVKQYLKKGALTS